MRILIAEDDPVSRRILEAHLTKWGYEIIIARDGLEAWAALQQPDAPKLVILDWMMPGIDGVEVIRKLRERRNLPYVYALLLTAKDQKEDLIAGLDAGADDYVTKPFDAHELQARIRTGRRILSLQEELIAAREALREKATHDHLTGIWNHAGILDILQRECARSRRSGGSVGLVIADLDHFKRVNDTYGHLGGDDALREVARRMQGSIRAYDSVGRYGGEEFLIVLPDCHANAAFHHAERLRHVVGGEPVTAAGSSFPVTLSLGVAASDQAGCENCQALLQAADAALYKAKGAGRNRALLAAPDANLILASPSS
ncbi:MAG: GGDEF domain-containing protein [Terriglobia bacterium]